MAGTTEDAFLQSLAAAEDPAASAVSSVGANPLVGRIVNKRYRIDAVLGQGGMGLVFKAWDQSLSRHVAIKTLQPAYAGIKEILARFDVEARACAQIRHPGVVSVLNVEKAEILGREQPIIVMEYVEGRPLSKLIQERGGFSDEDVRDLGVQLLDAVAALHAFGVIHRDLKPANVLVREVDGRLRLTVVDLGLGKVAALQDRSRPGVAGLTEMGGFLGTAAYSSPEQVLDASTVSHRTDLYSCGIILFEMIAGRPPYQGTHSEVKQAHLTAPLPPVNLKLPGRWLAPDVESLLNKATAKRPEDRFSCAAVMRDKLAAARLRPEEYRPARRSSVPIPALAPRRPVQAARPKTASAPRAAGWVLPAGIVALLLAAASAAGLAFLRSSERSATSAPAPVAHEDEKAKAAVEPAETPTTARGCELSERGRARDAVAMLERVVKDDPKDADAWYCLATSAAFVEGGEAAAERAYRAFLDLRPRDRVKRGRAEAWLRHNASR